jgi:hypothetical protein
MKSDVGSRSAPRIILLASFILSLTPLAAQDVRNQSIDVILLVDKSLSMNIAIDDVKHYVAGDIIGSVLLPGDRLVIELFYGKTETLYSGTLESEADKARVVGMLQGIRADGRFTDIGSALDRIDVILANLGSQERPKLVMLLTDERQEAPVGTKYFSPDYVAVHPYLTYVDRVDHGSFRAIVVGADLNAKISNLAGQVLTFLSSPPEGRASTADEGDTQLDLQESLEKAASAEAERGGTLDMILIAAASTLFAGLAALAIVALVRRKRRRDEERKPEAMDAGN